MTALPPGTARAARSVDRRAQLLAAADRVVRRDGPEASMNAIAAEAGISKPILYRHFGAKGGLYRALTAYYIDELLGRLRAALATRGGLQARTRATIAAYLSAIAEQREVYRFLMQRAAVEEPGVRGAVDSFVRRFGEELSVGMLHEPELAGVSEVRAQVWAQAIAGMVQAGGDWWLDHPDVALERVVTEVATLVLAAFAAQRTPSADQ